MVPFVAERMVIDLDSSGLSGLLFDVSADAIIVVAEDGTIVRANAACERLLGYSPDELHGKPVEFLVPERFPRHGQLRADYAQKSQPRPMGRGLALCARHADGREIPVDIALSPLAIGGHRLAAAAIRDMRGSATDPDALRIQATALRSAANGIVITDVNASIEWANPAFTAMTGRTLAEAVGRTPGEVLNSGRQDAAFYQRMWATILAGQVWSGELVNRRKDGSLYDEALTISPVTDMNGRIQHFVAIKQDISERKLTEERVQHLAHHDQLTDLPNRALLSDRLAQAVAQARRDRGTLALMFLDLDQFKPVNDTLGHDIGDLLLKEVALRLQACVPRESDTVSRLGGDEFVILLAQMDKAADAVVVAGKVLAALERPFAIGTHAIGSSASLGIAVYPQHGEDVNRLLKNADTAMYHAKRAGRNCYRFFRTLTDKAGAETEYRQ